MAPAGFAEMLTETGNVELTVSVMIFEVAGDPLAQVAFDVNTQVT